MTNSYKPHNYKWLIGLLLGIVLLALGFITNQYTDILQKARMICLECIGIG